MKKLFALVLALVVLALPVCALADGVQDGTGAEGTLTDTEIKTSFIEPNYYPDYDEAEAEETETAPKTGDFSMLPQIMMAVAAAGSLVVASKRAK